MSRPVGGLRFLSASMAMGIVQGYQRSARREFADAGVMLPERIGIPIGRPSDGHEIVLAHQIVLENVYSQLSKSHSFGEMVEVAHSLLARLGKEKLNGTPLREMIGQEAERIRADR